jgi:glutamate-1-semialdehyde 2,1-aminomutase
MPGGVSSPVRAFKAVRGEPRFIARGAGSRIEDVDGRSYIDLVMSFGPLILGHGHPEVVAAIVEQAPSGTAFGAPSIPELELAEAICRLIPSVEVVRLVNSGTEAVMSALRLARAATGRSRLLKFDGAYHGHYDPMLASAGSGLATLGLEASAAGTRVVPYNDLDAAAAILKGEDIAAVIVEPVAANMGVVLPEPGFLSGLRDHCDRTGTLLIFDEVITGFRVAPGGAQELFGVTPDLTVLGKIIGGGLPIGAYGGRADLMRRVSPDGPVYQAGTLSGNPLAAAAGLATLRVLEREHPYARLEAAGAELERSLGGLGLTLNRCGSLLTLFLTSSPVTDLASARTTDVEAYADLHQHALSDGVYLPPSQFEALFLSIAHSREDIGAVASALSKGVRAAAGAGAQQA